MCGFGITILNHHCLIGIILEIQVFCHLCLSVFSDRNIWKPLFLHIQHILFYVRLRFTYLDRMGLLNLVCMNAIIKVYHFTLNSFNDWVLYGSSLTCFLTRFRYSESQKIVDFGYHVFSSWQFASKVKLRVELFVSFQRNAF